MEAGATVVLGASEACDESVDCDAVDDELGALVAPVDCDAVEEVATVVLGASVACDDTVDCNAVEDELGAVVSAVDCAEAVDSDAAKVASVELDDNVTIVDVVGATVVTGAGVAAVQSAGSQCAPLAS